LKIKELYCRLIEDSITEFWNQYYIDEARFIDALVMMTFESTKFSDLKYKQHINQIVNLQSSYNKMQKQRYLKFKKLFYENVKILESQFNVLNSSIINYSDIEQETAKIYYANLRKIINNSCRDNSTNYQVITASIASNNQTKFKNEKDLRDKEINNLKNEIENINGDYLQEETNIATKKKDYNQKAIEQNNLYLEKHNAKIKNIKESMSASKAKYEIDLRTSLKEINLEFKEEIKTIELERKTKLKIGQI
jgi:hypothetical protein